MIDFIHPKSRYLFISKIFSLVILILLGTGLYLILEPVKSVSSEEKKTNLGGFTELPANIPPEEYLLTDLHLPLNKVVEPTTSEVLGASYNQQALNDLITKKNVNKIIIPKIGVDSEILEGNNEEVLWRGIWRMPVGSTPDQGGNTVITAHRYLYRPPNPKTFYLIDKLVPGDLITIYWEGIKYEYKVIESKIVEPDDISILYNTNEDRLTIFSCTPLFTSKQRLVVISEKI